jgi:hypothetical protein
MADNPETAREKAIAKGTFIPQTTIPTGNNYGAFAESPFYQANPELAPTGPTGPTTGATGPTGGSTNATGPTQQPKSAFAVALDLLAKYGIDSLAPSVQSLLQENIGINEFSVRLKDTDPYKKRFAANASRIGKGLRALSEAEYIALEDSYAKTFRNYGLPPSYYTKGTDGISKNFEALIAGDVDSTEIEDRIMIAQKRVKDAAPEVKQALKDFYPDIKDADILAYTLDPTKGMEEIKRKVTAAEIGGAALGQGLGTSASRAEELARFGVDAAKAREGYQAIAEIAPRGSQLASIYGESPYGQTEAEQEIFNLSGSAAAGQKRKKIAGLETAAFGGQSGTTAGALSRDRAGSF